MRPLSAPGQKAGFSNYENAATRPGALYASRIRHALELASEWESPQQARNAAVAATCLASPTATDHNADASALGHKAEKPHRIIFAEIKAFQGMATHSRALELCRDGPRRLVYRLAAADRCPNQLLTGTPMPPRKKKRESGKSMCIAKSPEVPSQK